MNRVLRLIVISLMVTWSVGVVAEPAPENAAIAENAINKAKSQVAEEEEEEEDAKDWSVSASLTTGIGQGTFTSIDTSTTEFADEVEDPANAYDRWNLGLSLSPSYTIEDLITVSGSVAWTQGLVAGGGINEPNELRFQDIGLDVAWTGHTFEAVPISVDAGLSFTLPTSDVSQTASLILGTSVNGSVSYTLFDKVRFAYSTSVGKDFHEFTSPVIDEAEVGAENAIWRAGGSERVGAGLLAIDGVNTEWVWSNSLSASFPIWDKLRMSASYSLATFWTYDVLKKDEFSNEVAQDGRGVGQSMSSGVTLSYPVLDYLSVSAGIRTSTQPKTADNRSFNFPFWNVDGAASNASQLRFGISANY
ncbi:MAG: hypothetical protein R3E66_03750 [bacterium]